MKPASCSPSITTAAGTGIIASLKPSWPTAPSAALTLSKAGYRAPAGAMHGWRGYKVNGGGMVLDWGVHLVDQLLDMTDSPVVSVDAHLLSVFTPEVEDNIKILLRFENGLSALV